MTSDNTYRTAFQSRDSPGRSAGPVIEASKLTTRQVLPQGFTSGGSPELAVLPEYFCLLGHRDTDNLIRHNVIRRSGENGIIFREHPHPGRDPHRNLLEDNLIEDLSLIHI